MIGGNALHCGQDHVAGAITRLFSGAALQRCAESVRLSLGIFGESGEDLLAGRLCIKAGDLSEALCFQLANVTGEPPAGGACRSGLLLREGR